jgi:hypothetical protein
MRNTITKKLRTARNIGEEGKVWKVEKVGKARKAGKVKHKMAALSLFFVGNLSEELHGLK